MRSLLFALPDLQPQAERGREVTIHGSSFDEDRRMIDPPEELAFMTYCAHADSLTIPWESLCESDKETWRKMSETCTASVPISDPDDGTSHDMGCTLPTGHIGKHICECGVMWTPREPSAQAKLDAIRVLVNESLARMEPVSWIDALTDILDGGSDGQA